MRWPGLVLVLLLAGACSSPRADALPDLELERLDGGTVDLAAPSEIPMVLNLWATWCAPCRRELPAFDQIQRETTGAVAFVGVNQGDDRASARSMIDEIGVEFPQTVDTDSELSRALAITNMPSTVFVSASGEILETHAGELDAEELAGRLQDLFGITPSTP